MPRAATSALVTLLLACAASCGDAPLLDLKVVAPEGADPLAAADRLRLVVTEPAAETTGTLGAGGTLTLETEVEVSGATGAVILEGYTADRLIARGETPPLSLTPKARQLALLVGRAGEVGTLKTQLPVAAHGIAPVLVPASGLLLAGGGDAASRPIASVVLYDFFQHSLVPLAGLPEPRLEAVGVSCGSDCALVALGVGAAGLADKIFRLEEGAWTAFPDRLATTDRRRGAGAALLSDGSTLVVGGEGVQGALDTALRLRPGGGTADPSLELVSARSLARRSRPALASVGSVVLIVGGQPAGAPAAELFYTSGGSFQALALPGVAPASGSAVCELADGKLAVVGGRDESGALLRDGWIVDPIAPSVTKVPGCLGEGRADHALVRAGRQLVVVGGLAESGPAATAEVLGPDLVKVGQGKAAPRTEFAIGRVGPGAFLIAGGRSAGAPTPVLEIFETSVPWGR